MKLLNIIKNFVTSREGKTILLMIGIAVFGVVFFSAGGVYATPIDAQLEKGEQLFETILHWIGRLVIAIAVIMMAVGFLGHDNEKKILGVGIIVVGFAIRYAPEIAAWF